MDGPRGSLVIALLFLIAGQLAFIASALTGGGGFSLLGFVMCVFFALGLFRVFIELYREGAAQARKDEAAERAEQRRERTATKAAKRRAAEPAAQTVPAPVTPTGMVDPDSRTPVSHLDPQKRRPAQG